jgi:hypothetical protein
MTCILFRPPHISSRHRLWTYLGKQANVLSWYLPGLAVYYARLLAGLMSFARAPLETSRCLAYEEEEDFLAIDDPARRSDYSATPLVRVRPPPGLVVSSYCGMGIHFGLADVTASCGLGLASHAIDDVSRPRIRRMKGRIPHLQRIKGTGANAQVASRRSDLDTPGPERV